METKQLLKNNVWQALFLFWGLFALNACDDKSNGGAHDPRKPVEVISFSPLEGAAKTRLYITGKNFGTNVSKIFVKIGGVNARVIGSDGEIIYCLVPFGVSADGTVEVAVGEDAASAQYVPADQTFGYKKTRQVKTLCGYVDEYGKSEAKDGSFDICGFAQPRWLAVDPQNQNQLYLVDGAAGDNIRILDIEKRTVRTMLSKGQGGWKHIRQISFTVTGDTLLVANEEGKDDAVGVAMLLRSQNYQQPTVVCYANENNACCTNPTNGELYFNSRKDGTLYRYDWETQERENLGTVLNGKSAQFFIFFHPVGDYAYICVPNQRIIMKAEYDYEKKMLKTPTIFCGDVGQQNYRDGNGTNARLGNPMQGVFVKNEEYVREGKEDHYDFYFCDQYAHAIRYVTPEADVRTFAGRGSKGLNNDPKGYIDGELLEEARFDQPQGLTFDSENEIFYIAEYQNKRIRTISLNAE